MHICTLQTGDNLETILKERIFMEPRLVIFRDSNEEYTQGFIVAEQEVIFEVDRFDIVEGLISLIASYYFFLFPTQRD